ncbi:hypothetical protein DASC09_030700 [Saccharomycopsis crataegensis]|uniref:Pex N-terminal domain-containing protein n=1 Tax=Saccharomycopsis crataegensis TaxID=43959 RepID=A0AAV5QMI0_9ASCO|nr:hypothetical protein DASC09_030700 [Saccharomycopsis crataegensis]
MSRVAQLDSILLDKEIYSLLFNQISSSLSKFNKSLLSAHSSEIQLILKSLLFKYTLWDNSNTYGFHLSNLSLVNNKNERLSRSIKALYYILFVFGDYLSEKLSSYIFALDEDDDDNEESRSILSKYAKQFIVYSLRALKILNLVNFVKFLIDGKYNSLKFQLLNIKTKISSLDFEKMVKGNVNYEFQNRQILWNTLIEFVMFLLPIFLKISKRKPQMASKKKRSSFKGFKMISDFFNGKHFNDNYESLEEALGDQDSDDIEQNVVKTLDWLPQSQCAICYESKTGPTVDSNPITNPYITNCGHVYSYLCILEKLQRHKPSHHQTLATLKIIKMTKKNEDLVDYWRCLRCSEPVLWCQPYNDIDEGAILARNEEDDIGNENEDIDDSAYEEGELQGSHIERTDSLASGSEFLSIERPRLDDDDENFDENELSEAYESLDDIDELNEEFEL